MMGNRTNEQWIAQYASSHTNPVNRFCHTVGIPMIAVSLPLFVAAFFVPRVWIVPVGLVLLGWMFLFIGHYFEGERPEFLCDYRFLFVGVRWWVAEMRGRG